MADASRRAILAAPLLMAAGPTTTDAWSFRIPSLDGGEHDLGAWRGRVLLVVNTASFCGYTPQYAALQRLHERFQARGLTVLGVPSNDFNQESTEAGRELVTETNAIYQEMKRLQEETGKTSRSQNTKLR